MTFRTPTMGTTLLSQTLIGILGNFSLFYCLQHDQCLQKPTDLILKHLVLANSLTLLFNGVPLSIAAFGWKHFLDDLGCKVFFYIQRVGRSVAISTTCLLGVCQAVTISQNNSCLKDLRLESSISFCVNLCWALHLVLNMSFPLYAHSKWILTNRTKKRDFQYCGSECSDETMRAMYTALLLFPELCFSVLITVASGAMVLFLTKHVKQVQYLHGPQAYPRVSPEFRAVHSILTLGSTFIILYTVSSILSIWVAFCSSPSGWLINLNTLISMCFPTLSPFILLKHHIRRARPCSGLKRNTKSFVRRMRDCMVHVLFIQSF
ncbi:vomeronasal type-1 receptor 4-like [Perognathus longimembris pacificus]|uniref:vomeronasal type-1 receptor 4-like n=1 Tax=Perognathus longimembris pacificus TaxID=214514 RepID=UPI00201901FF|nr:vomeronasal type-1 receptor 4-like [Perognathus longimembris pacificus]